MESIRDNMNNRERLWGAAHAIIESNRSKFPDFMGINLATEAEKIAWDNIMNILTDEEVNKIIEQVKSYVNSP